MVHTGTFSLPPVNRREVLRYAGVREESAQLTELLEAILPEALPVLTANVCWQEFSLHDLDHGMDLGFAQVRSDSLARNLTGCDKIILFAATAGLGIDRLIARYGRLSPAKALMLQALGTERIEALCNLFQEEIRQDAAARQLHAVSRFSPGYGDLPLELQRDIFLTLNCSSKSV